MTETKAPKQRRSFFYGCARVLAQVVFHTLCPLKVHGAERVNGKPPFIIIANHNSWMDPVAMCYPIHHHEVTFMGKKELVKNPIAGAILREMHIIAVDRHNTDMVAMRACMKALRDGGILGIFPEGTRHHKGLMEEIEGGTALIALRCDVPLIPIYIDRKIRCFHRTNMYIGEPIPMEDLREQGVNKASCEQLLQRITATYAEMARSCKA